MSRPGSSSQQGLVAVALVLLGWIATGPQHVRCEDFGYDGSMGPSNWGKQYKTCNGKHQSPININLLEVNDITLQALDILNFHQPPISAEMVNNGHTVAVRMEFPDDPPFLSGGPLHPHAYKFSQFHFHWGDNDTFGSEDRINNVSFPAELHMVFFNHIYENFEMALNHNNGIAVLAYFFMIQEQDNAFYVQFTDLLEKIREPDTKTVFKNPPALGNFANSNLKSYYTYIGSLTTPPCSEDVIWIDFIDPIMISAKQIEAFRHLNSHHGIPMTHNFRPIQPLNNRTVYRAMPPEHFKSAQQHVSAGAESTTPRGRFRGEKTSGASEAAAQSTFRLFGTCLIVTLFLKYF